MDPNCRAYVVDRLRVCQVALDEAWSAATAGQEVVLRGCVRDAQHQLELIRAASDRPGGFGGGLP